MADLSTSFDPAAVGTSSDASSDAKSRADAASDAASKALSKIAAQSAAWEEPVLTAVPGSDCLASGVTITLTAGVTVNFGDVGYLASTGKVLLGDADAIATASCVIMCAAAQIAADAAGKFLLFGIVRNDAWTWTVGGLIYLSVTGTTGNTLTQAPPSATDDVIQIVGVATHADRMFFNPQLVQVEHV